MMKKSSSTSFSHSPDYSRPDADAIVFTDGHAPVPLPPSNRRTRLLWLFKSEESHRQRHAAQRAPGRTSYLKWSRTQEYPRTIIR
jgi:predicted metal-dependent peptidase